MAVLTEADVEQAALEWIAALGWRVSHGPDIGFDTPGAEGEDYGQAVLAWRLRDALADLNPGLPVAEDDVYRTLTRPQGATLEARNRESLWMLVNDLGIESREAGGVVGGDIASAINSEDPNCSASLASLCSKIQLKLCGRKAQDPPIRIDGPFGWRIGSVADPPWIPACAGMTNQTSLDEFAPAS